MKKIIILVLSVISIFVVAQINNGELYEESNIINNSLDSNGNKIQNLGNNKVNGVEFKVNNWKYDNWVHSESYTKDSKLSHSSNWLTKFFGGSTTYTNSDETFKRTYKGSYCAKRVLVICINTKYKYEEHVRNKWAESGYNQKIENKWVGEELYAIETRQEVKLEGFSQKKVVDKEGYYKTTGYKTKREKKYTSWSSWDYYESSSKLSNSGPWPFSTKYSTDTYEREYRGSYCESRHWYGICKTTKYKYKKRSRRSYYTNVNDYSNPIKKWVSSTYKNEDDKSKPIYEVNGEFEFEEATLLASANAIVHGVEEYGIYDDNETITLNWTNNNSELGITYTAKLNGVNISRNKKIRSDGMYLLEIFGKNKNNKIYKKEIIFSIANNENINVLDYKDENDETYYREMLYINEESTVTTKENNGNTYFIPTGNVGKYNDKYIIKNYFVEDNSYLSVNKKLNFAIDQGLGIDWNLVGAGLVAAGNATVALLSAPVVVGVVVVVVVAVGVYVVIKNWDKIIGLGKTIIDIGNSIGSFIYDVGSKISDGLENVCDSIVSFTKGLFFNETSTSNVLSAYEIVNTFENARYLNCMTIVPMAIAVETYYALDSGEIDLEGIVDRTRDLSNRTTAINKLEVESMSAFLLALSSEKLPILNDNENIEIQLKNYFEKYLTDFSVLNFEHGMKIKFNHVVENCSSEIAFDFNFNSNLEYSFSNIRFV